MRGTTFDAEKDALRRSDSFAVEEAGADGVIDAGAIRMGAMDATRIRLTSRATRCIRPPRASCWLPVRRAMRLNYYFGLQQTNPTMSSTASYTMTAGDGAVSATPTANADVDAAGLHGAERGGVYDQQSAVGIIR